MHELHGVLGQVQELHELHDVRGELGALRALHEQVCALHGELGEAVQVLHDGRGGVLGGALGPPLGVLHGPGVQWLGRGEGRGALHDEGQGALRGVLRGEASVELHDVLHGEALHDVLHDGPGVGAGG